MALCLPTLKLFKQKHNPFKTLQPCARSSSSCTSSSFLTSLFSLRLKPLFVFICLYLSLFVFICFYLSLFLFICLYLSLFVFNLSLFVFICQNLPILSNKPCRSNQTANELLRLLVLRRTTTTTTATAAATTTTAPTWMHGLVWGPHLPSALSYIHTMKSCTASSWGTCEGQAGQ